MRPLFFQPNPMLHVQDGVRNEQWFGCRPSCMDCVADDLHARRLIGCRCFRRPPNRSTGRLTFFLWYWCCGRHPSYSVSCEPDPLERATGTDWVELSKHKPVDFIDVTASVLYHRDLNGDAHSVSVAVRKVHRYRNPLFSSAMIETNDRLH